MNMNLAYFTASRNAIKMPAQVSGHSTLNSTQQPIVNVLDTSREVGLLRQPTLRPATAEWKYLPSTLGDPFLSGNYLSFFLWRLARLRFFLLCVLILCRLRFLPQGIDPPSKALTVTTIAS
jgi:hypothetical protein